MVSRHVKRDRGQPCSRRRLAPKAPGGSSGPQQGLLHQVIGQSFVPHEAEEYAAYRLSMHSNLFRRRSRNHQRPL